MKYTVRIDDTEYEVEIKDLRARPIIAVVEGEAFEIMPGNGQSMVAAAPPSQIQPAATSAVQAVKPPPTVSAPSVGPSSAGVVRAPIPGVILEIKVKAGDVVSPGQELFVIEAMKMKNTIRATRSGMIAEILTLPGTTVNHNAPVLSYQED